VDSCTVDAVWRSATQKDAPSRGRRLSFRVTLVPLSTMASPSISCPFCAFHTTDSNRITLHVEQQHIEDSPFAQQKKDPISEPHSSQNEDDASFDLACALQAEETAHCAAIAADEEASARLALTLHGHDGRQQETCEDGDFPYVECDVCADFIHLADIDDHSDLHAVSPKSSLNDIVKSIVSPTTTSRYTSTQRASSLRIQPAHRSFSGFQSFQAPSDDQAVDEMEESPLAEMARSAAIKRDSLIRRQGVSRLIFTHI